MFKVTTIDNRAQSVLVLEGSLVGPWLPELKRTWDEARQTHEGGTLVVDLTKVTIVSQHGENILFEMMNEGARVVGNSFLAREIRKQLERRRHRQGDERNGRFRTSSFVVGTVLLLAMAGQSSWAFTRYQPHATSDAPPIEALSAGIPDDRETQPLPMRASRPQEGEVVVADLPFSSLQLSDSLVSYLELTQSQIAMIQVLVGTERQRIDPVLTQLSTNRQLLVTATKNGRFDEKQIRKLATQQSRLMAELIIATSRFQAELYALLTPEQQRKADEAHGWKDGAYETPEP